MWRTPSKMVFFRFDAFGTFTRGRHFFFRLWCPFVLPLKCRAGCREEKEEEEEERCDVGTYLLLVAVLFSLLLKTPTVLLSLHIWHPFVLAKQIHCNEAEGSCSIFNKQAWLATNWSKFWLPVRSSLVFSRLGKKVWSRDGTTAELKVCFVNGYPFNVGLLVWIILRKVRASS